MNQYGNSYTPSQLGVRPSVALSTAFLSQAFIWMFAGLLVTTGVGWWISSLSAGSLERVSGLLFPVLIGQVVLALAFGFLLRRMPATLGLGLFFLYAAATGVTMTAVKKAKAQSKRILFPFYWIVFAVSAITGRQICCCSRMKAVSSSGVVRRM